MVFDLTFEEAMDVVFNRIGLVQGERFNSDEYLAYDVRKDYIIKNVVADNSVPSVPDYYGKQTKAVYSNVSFIPEEMRTQKYRFILVHNPDAVRGIGGFATGDDRNCYLFYKAISMRKR